MKQKPPKVLCKCGHTQGQHFRTKYWTRESKTGCSRCTCFEFQATAP